MAVLYACARRACTRTTSFRPRILLYFCLSLHVMAEAFAGLFEKAQQGDSFAQDAVYKLAFHRLRVIASALLRRERPGHTLQPTALVSELFLKLRRLETQVLNEDHFFRMSARAMRQVLIDHSRVTRPAKKVPLDLILELLPPV